MLDPNPGAKMYDMAGPTFDVRLSIEDLLNRIDQGRKDYKTTQPIRDKFEKIFRTRDKAHQTATDLLPTIASSTEPKKSELHSKYVRKMAQFHRLNKKADYQAPLASQTTKFIRIFRDDFLLFLQRLPLKPIWQEYRHAIEHLSVGILDSWADPPSNPALELLKMRLNEMLELARKTRPDQVTRVQPFATPDGASWKDVSITFLSEHRVTITVLETTDTRGFAEMGFEDRRGGGGKPDSGWECLKYLAEFNGEIARPVDFDRQGWPKVEKQIQTVRKRLRAFFEITGDPLPFRKNRGYATQLTIKLGNSTKY